MSRLPRPRLSLSRAVPTGAVIAVGAVLAGTMLASASAPDLPRQTPAQLLAAMRHAGVHTVGQLRHEERDHHEFVLVLWPRARERAA